MIDSNWRLKLTSLATGITLVSGCATSLRYRPKAKRVAPAQHEHEIMLVDILDGRDRSNRSDLPLVHKRTPEKSLGQLRKAARKHAKRSRLVGDDELFVAAPTNVTELEQVLAHARVVGAKAVLITRLEGLYAQGMSSPVHDIFTVINLITIYFGAVALLPSIIGYSIPLAKEYASAKVAAFLVDPATGLVFARYEKSFVHTDMTVSAWGYAPTGELKGVLRHTMQQVYEEAAQIMANADPKGGPQIAIATVLFGGDEEQDHD